MLFTKTVDKVQNVTFLPALPLDARMFLPQIEAFYGEANLLALTYPGFGRSPLKESLKLEDYAALVLESWNKLGIAQSDIVGVSMGAQLALWIAYHHPERVRRLVLSSTHALPSVPEEKAMFTEIAQAARAQGSATLVDQLLGMLLSSETRQNTPEVTALVRRLILDAHGEGMASAFLALAERSDPTPWIQTISHPVCLIYGEYDQAVPPAHIEALQTNLKQAELTMLPSGHYPNLETKEAYNEKVRRFLFS